MKTGPAGRAREACLENAAELPGLCYRSNANPASAPKYLAPSDPMYRPSA